MAFRNSKLVIYMLVGLILGVLLDTYLVFAQELNPLSELEVRILKQPRDHDLYLELLNAGLAGHAMDGVITFLKTIIERDPSNDVAKYALGHAYKRVGDLKNAETQWKEVFKTNPSHESAARELATIYMARRDTFRAVNVLAAFGETSRRRTSPAKPETLFLMIKVITKFAEHKSQNHAAVTPDEFRLLGLMIKEIDQTLGMMELWPIIHNRSTYRRIPVPEIKEASVLANLAKACGSLMDLYDRFAQQAERQNRLDLSDYYFRLAFALADPIKCPAAFAKVGGNLAHLLGNMGKYEEAESQYDWVIRHGEQFLASKPNEQQTLYLANNYYNASNMAWNQGKFSTSISRLYKAESYYRQESPTPGLSRDNHIRIYETLMDRYLKLNNHPKARIEAQRLVELLDNNEIKLPTDLVRAYTVMAEVEIIRGSFKAAQDAINKAYEMVDQARGTERRISNNMQFKLHLVSLRNLAVQGDQWDTLTGQGKYMLMEYDKALQEIDFSEESRKDIRLFQAEVSLILIRGFLGRNNLEGIDELFDRLEIGLPANDPEGRQIDALYLQGRYYQQLGEDEEAEEYYARMVGALQTFRMGIPVSDNLYYSEQQRARYFTDYISFLVSHKKFSDALDMLETSRAHTLQRTMELNLSDIKSTAESEKINRVQHLAWKTLAITRQLYKEDRPEYRRQLESELNQATLEYKKLFSAISPMLQGSHERKSLGEILNSISGISSHILVLWMDPNSNTLTEWWLKDGKLVETRNRSVNAAQLREEIEGFIRASINGDLNVKLHDTTFDYWDLANTLGETLLSGVKALPPHSQLVIIPDSYLQGIPFSALHLSGVPLVHEQVDSLSYAPSLRTLAFHAQRHPIEPDTSGLFVGFREVGKTYEKLRFAEEDAKFMSEVFKNAKRSQTLVTRLIGREELKKAMKDRGLIVISTHGKLDPGNPMAAVLIFPNNMTVEASEMFEWPLGGSRVILSACEVGRDVAAPNQDVLGMTLPLFAAGARSVLHAEWSVDQKITSSLVRDIVTSISEGKNMSEALTLAQQKYLKNAPGGLRLPKYWAAWRVIGQG